MERNLAFEQDAEAFRTKPPQEVIPSLLNNFHQHLPGEQYRTMKKGGRDRALHAKLDEILREVDTDGMAKRIVEKDTTLDGKERREFLIRLYMQMREAGFSNSELTM